MAIQWLGTKRIKLDTIVLPAGFAKRKKEPHVARLAESIKAGGMIALPVVTDKPRKLVAGGDRLAALMLNKTASHEVRLVRGTPEEIEALMLEENLLRRRGDDYDAMTRRLVELHRGAIESEAKAVVGRGKDGEELAAPPWSGAPTDADWKSTDTPKKRGRPKTSQGAARELVAKATGKSPEAVRQAEKRAKEAEKEAAKPPGPPPPPVETWDLVLDSRTVKEFEIVRICQAAIDETERFLKSALRSINALKDGGALAKAVHSRCASSVQEAGAVVRRAGVDAICPYCKHVPTLRKDCTGCGGTGYVSNDALDNIDAALKQKGSSAVVPDGRGGMMPIADALRRTNGGGKGPAKGARKVRVVDAAGDEIPVDDEPVFTDHEGNPEGDTDIAF